MIEAGWECKLHLFGDEQLRTLVRLNCSEDEYRRAQRWGGKLSNWIFDLG